MTGLTPVSTQRRITINAATGVGYAFIPSSLLVGRKNGVQGHVLGVSARLETGSTRDVATLQVWLLDCNDDFVDIANLEADPDDYPESIQLFRSDATVVADANGSDITSTIEETFADTPELYSSGLLVAVGWTTSGGTGTGSVLVTVDQEVAAP